jgi:hypothetical protein
MPWVVSFHIWGEQFKPSQIDFAFSDAHDPGIIGQSGKYRGQSVPYGSATVRVPSHIPNEERIRYIVTAALPLLPKLEQAGATDWHLDIGRFYSTQCNEEYSAEELALMSQLRCPLDYSAYQVSEEEEVELISRMETFTR